MSEGVSLRLDGSVKLSNNFRARLNHRLKAQLEKYGIDFPNGASPEAKALMLGITLLWDSSKTKVNLKQPETCPICGINSFRLDVHMRAHAVKEVNPDEC